MNLKQMLQIEASKQPGTVALFESGLFYMACEGSAYKLWRCYGFNPTKRHYKVLGTDMVGVGFPRRMLEKYVPGCVAGPDGTLAGSLNVSEEGFAEWKASVKLTEGRRNSDKTAAPPLKGIDGLGGGPMQRHPLSGHFDGLPVYKECYDLLLAVVEWSRNLDKVYQHHLLNRMVDRLFELEVHICAAREKSTSAEALEEVEQAQRKLVEVSVALRMLGDKNKLNPNVYADATMRVASLDRQLLLWRATLPYAV
ncbi:MAG: hypothetical protein IJU81_03135 [Bacteroidales bacterium]|nr:hypothetical protein [Bacteroidales bacterium]